MPRSGLRADFGAAADRRAWCRASRRQRAGLRAGDRIVAIDGEPVRSPAEVAARTNAQAGRAVVFRIARDGAESDIT